MFIEYSVKDKNNILTHNIWSAGEYLNSLSDITVGNNANAVISSDWAYNGNSSIKFTQTGSGGSRSMLISYSYSEVGNTLTASINCLNTANISYLKFYQLKDGSVLGSQTVNIPASNDMQTVSATFTTVDTINTLRIVIETTDNVGQTIFVDNIKIQ